VVRVGIRNQLKTKGKQAKLRRAFLIPIRLHNFVEVAGIHELAVATIGKGLGLPYL